MEQGEFCNWMNTKRKYYSNYDDFINKNLSYNSSSSWEEKAFAEDEACIWPPRSYSCSFCTREFRSAQALGGHMNVHRRDRAKLKHPSTSSPQNDETLYHHHHQKINPSSQSTYLYPSFSKTISNNPNSDPDFLASSPNSKALALAPSLQIPLYNNKSSILINHKISPVNSSDSWPSLNGDHRLYSNSSKSFNPPEKAGIENLSKGVDSRCRGKGDDNIDEDGDDDDDIDVAMRLNLVMCRAKESDMNSFKKRKIDAPPSVLFLPKSTCSVDTRHTKQPKMFEFSPSSIEGLDLELRLGNE